DRLLQSPRAKVQQRRLLQQSGRDAARGRVVTLPVAEWRVVNNVHDGILRKSAISARTFSTSFGSAALRGSAFNSSRCLGRASKKSAGAGHVLRVCERLTNACLTRGASLPSSHTRLAVMASTQAPTVPWIRSIAGVLSKL